MITKDDYEIKFNVVSLFQENDVKKASRSHLQ